MDTNKPEESRIEPTEAQEVTLNLKMSISSKFDLFLIFKDEQ
jgi:hypothetical protein